MDIAFNRTDPGQRLSFSICLGPVGGVLSLGGMNYDKHLPNTAIYTVPVSRDSLFYHISIKGVSLPGVQIDLQQTDFDQEYGSFLDSGSTIVWAHRKVYEYGQALVS